MKTNLLKNKAGVTLLEGLIALGLLALITAGTFGVLLSVSRQSSQPDIREEMLWAIERANEGLQLFAGENPGTLPTEYEQGLCGADNDPLADGSHNINCMLPAICDIDDNDTYFTYEVSTVSLPTLDNQFSANGGYNLTFYARDVDTAYFQVKNITYHIKCHGFTL